LLELNRIIPDAVFICWRALLDVLKRLTILDGGQRLFAGAPYRTCLRGWRSAIWPAFILWDWLYQRRAG